MTASVSLVRINIDHKDVIDDDKVEQYQVDSWRAYRKKMKRQSKVHDYYKSQRRAILLQKIVDDCNNDYEIRQAASTDTLLVSNVPNNSEEESFRVMKEKYGWNRIVLDAMCKEIIIEEEKENNEANSKLNNLILGLRQLKNFRNYSMFCEV